MAVTPALRPAPAAPPPDRLARLKAQPRKPGEASFFFHDAHFDNDAVKILPCEWFVHDEDILIMTTLGSCIAACLWDRERRLGGMNHFMLPDGDASGSGRYGSYAMELLINELLKRGASRSTLEAKVFGGGAVIEGMHSMNIGERNTAFVIDYLKTERIPIVSQDVMGPCPRKICFLPRSGKAMVKRLAATSAALVAQDRSASQRAVPQATAGGTVDLF